VTSPLRLAKKARLKFDDRTKRYLLLYPERGLELSDTAAAILDLCDGTRSTGDIAAELCARYPNSDPEAVRADVATFLDQLRRRGLVEGE
jgi:coenzyme PQQ biosynthesis protein PqqD